MNVKLYSYMEMRKMGELRLRAHLAVIEKEITRLEHFRWYPVQNTNYGTTAATWISETSTHTTAIGSGSYTKIISKEEEKYLEDMKRQKRLALEALEAIEFHKRRGR